MVSASLEWSDGAHRVRSPIVVDSVWTEGFAIVRKLCFKYWNVVIDTYPLFLHGNQYDLFLGDPSK